MQVHETSWKCSPLFLTLISLLDDHVLKNMAKSFNCLV
jgi:hypothetical protein